MRRTLGLVLGLLSGVLPLGGQVTVRGVGRAADTAHHQRDSLLARITELEGAIRQYILAADHYATEARNAEALLNWYRHQPTACPVSREARTKPRD